jgi:hypothetical protein
LLEKLSIVGIIFVTITLSLEMLFEELLYFSKIFVKEKLDIDKTKILGIYFRIIFQDLSLISSCIDYVSKARKSA